MNIRDSILQLKDKLTQIYDNSEAESIAKIALEYILDIDINQFILHPNKTLSTNELLELNRIQIELLTNKPIQYITNRSWFDNEWFYVDKNVLIPRSETEELIELIKKKHPKESPLNIIDIGTGSGCIAIALKKHFSNSNVIAIDVSEKALEIAKKNSFNILGTNKITFMDLNVLELTNLPSKNIDIIVSNPPYVTQEDKTQMNNNVLNFEPHLALFEDSPLQFYSAIAKLANIKAHSMHLYFEINEKNGKDVKLILESEKYQNIQIIQDFQHKDRIAYGYLSK